MVDWRTRGHLGRIAVACMLLVVCAGCLCRPRRGLTIRGDSSLRMNRVPWMTGRFGSDQECYEEGAECPPGYPMAGEMSAVHPSAPPAPDQPDIDQTYPFAAESGSGYGIFRRYGHLWAPDYGQPAAVGTCPPHSRFHPVPTRPVFLARPDPYSGAGNYAPCQGVDTSDLSRPQDDAAPLPPELEVIPDP